MINGLKKIFSPRKPDFWYISCPLNKERCIEILRYFGNKDLPVFTLVENGRFAWCNKTSITFHDYLPNGIGVEIKQEPTIRQFQEVIHFRSGRIEKIKGTAILKMEDRSWKPCVIYGDYYNTFVRELENFKEAFINKEK